MATYRHSGRHSVDQVQDPNITTGYAKYLQDEEKAYPPAIMTEHDSETFDRTPETAKDLVTEVIHAVDDPSLNPVLHYSKICYCSRLDEQEISGLSGCGSSVSWKARLCMWTGPY